MSLICPDSVNINTYFACNLEIVRDIYISDIEILVTYGDGTINKTHINGIF